MTMNDLTNNNNRMTRSLIKENRAPGKSGMKRSVTFGGRAVIDQLCKKSNAAATEASRALALLRSRPLSTSMERLFNDRLPKSQSIPSIGNQSIMDQDVEDRVQDLMTQMQQMSAAMQAISCYLERDVEQQSANADGSTAMSEMAPPPPKIVVKATARINVPKPIIKSAPIKGTNRAAVPSRPNSRFAQKFK